MEKHANYHCNYSSADKTKHNSIWSNALSKPLTMWNYLVVNLTKGGNSTITMSLIFATGYVGFATTQVLATCKKLISTTAWKETEGYSLPVIPFNFKLHVCLTRTCETFLNHKKICVPSAGCPQNPSTFPEFFSLNVGFPDHYNEL